MNNATIKKVIIEMAETFTDMAKIFAILGYVVKKADKEGVLDALDHLSFKQIETNGKEKSGIKGACEDDLPGATCWDDLGHGFGKCLKCGAIRRQEMAGS